ncbi:hypothetical protein [Pseudomonas sp. Q1-7]|uniref:hypothetical protein n=1 Tax=Pseudomonas sp. Q1-7 TaxID=3020843 RepID=UPI0023009412|nr:hypothetical protein [Pseudomonas sp. Q1-7]
MSVPPDEFDRLMAYFNGRRAPRLPLKYAESTPDRAVLYRKMVKKEWEDAAKPIGGLYEGECTFDFRVAFKTYHTGDYARVWTSTELAKVRGFENDAKGGSDYVIAQFVFEEEMTTIFRGKILPQKMTGAQHMNEFVLMHREGYEPFRHGLLEVKMFSTVEEVEVTIARHKAFDLGFSVEHAVTLNKYLKFARLMDP